MTIAAFPLSEIAISGQAFAINPWTPTQPVSDTWTNVIPGSETWLPVAPSASAWTPVLPSSGN